MRQSDSPEQRTVREHIDPARLSDRLARLAAAHPSSDAAEVSHPPWPDDWTDHGSQQPDRQAADDHEAVGADQDAAEATSTAVPEDGRPGSGGGGGRRLGDAQIGSGTGHASYRPWFATGSCPEPWFAVGLDGQLAEPDPAGPDLTTPGG